MALSLKASLDTSDCLNLLFNETTGFYSSTNTGGWSTPNILISTATAATVAVTVPSGTVYSFNVFLAGFPSYNTNVTYSIAYDDLGFSEALEDGIYSVTYSVSGLDGSGEPITYTVTISTFIVCNLECCVDTLLLNVDDWECDCSEDAIDTYLSAFSILQQINHSIECGDLDTAESLLTLANKICKNSNCSTCT